MEYGEAMQGYADVAGLRSWLQTNGLDGRCDEAVRETIVLPRLTHVEFSAGTFGVIVQRALAGAQPGAIILLHDAGGNRSQTVAALPRIVRGLRARGYKLVTVPRLLLDNPAPHDQDVAGLQGAGG